MESVPTSLLMNHQLRRENAGLLRRIEALETAKKEIDSKQIAQANLTTNAVESLHDKLETQMQTLSQGYAELQKQLDASKRASDVVENDFRDRLGKLESSRSRRMEQIAATEGELYRKALASCQQKMEEVTAELCGRHDDTQQMKRQLSSLSKQVKHLADSTQRTRLQTTAGLRNSETQQLLSEPMTAGRGPGHQRHSQEHEVAGSPLRSLFVAREKQKTEALTKVASMGVPASALTGPNGSKADPDALLEQLSKKRKLPVEPDQGQSVATPVRQRSSFTSPPSKKAMHERQKAVQMSQAIERDSKGRFKKQLGAKRDKAARKERSSKVVKPRTTRSTRNKADTKLISPIKNPENILKRAKRGPRAEPKQMTDLTAVEDMREVVRELQQSETPKEAVTEYVNPWLAAFRQRQSNGAK